MAAGTFSKFIYSQLFASLPVPDTDASGQTIIVTGSNTGLGLEAVRHFVRLNAEKVIIAVRSLEKGEAAKQAIEKSENRPGVLEVWSLDLASYESVKQFAKRAEGLKRLDVLLENAGVAKVQYSTAEDNETTITTNVISTYLLALLLLPKLRETGQKFNTQPHLTITSSEVHAWSKFAERNSPDIFQTLNDKSTADMADRYQVSKLLEVFVTRELAAQTAPTASPSHPPAVIINYLNPGLCHSELGRDSGLFLSILKFFLARTTEQGSRTLVQAALAGPESHGQYMDNCAVGEVGGLAASEEAGRVQKRVWKELGAKLERISPGILQNV